MHGYETGRLEIDLLEEGRLVRTVGYEITPGRTNYTAVFEFTPVALGHRVYSVRVKPFAEEVTLENNERHAVIRVNRDKIRVLQIAGHPSWDVRFLRNHLRQTPNIQLISFFILIRQGQGRVFVLERPLLFHFLHSNCLSKSLEASISSFFKTSITD